MDRDLCTCGGCLGDNPDYCGACLDHIEERKADCYEEDLR